jgi:hypothetical protein
VKYIISSIENCRNIEFVPYRNIFEHMVQILGL